MYQSNEINQAVADYDTAVKLIKARNSRDPDWFCPLIKNMCNQKCYCFTKATFFKLRDDTFKIQEAFCDNSMFLGSDCGNG